MKKYGSPSLRVCLIIRFVSAVRLSVRRIIAMRIHASEVSASLSQSSLILRCLPSQAGVRSATRRLQES